MIKQDNIFIVAAPSGTGKTTLNRRLVSEFEEVEVSVSLTTRKIRPNETDGDHYHFVTLEDFKKEVAQGQMLEYAEVFGNNYGTSLHEVERIQNKGHKVLLEIDVQGWEQAREKIPNAHAIFILPPSVKAIWQRLEARGTDSIETRFHRIQTARQELTKGANFNHFIINDNLEEAYDSLKKIIIDGEKTGLDYHQGVAKCHELIQEFETATWLKEIQNRLETP